MNTTSIALLAAVGLITGVGLATRGCKSEPQTHDPYVNPSTPTQTSSLAPTPTPTPTPIVEPPPPPIPAPTPVPPPPPTPVPIPVPPPTPDPNSPHTNISFSNPLFWSGPFGGGMEKDNSDGMLLTYTGNTFNQDWANIHTQAQYAIGRNLDCSVGCQVILTVQGIAGAKTVGLSNFGIDFTSAGLEFNKTFDVSDGKEHTYSYWLPISTVPLGGFVLDFGNYSAPNPGLKNPIGSSVLFKSMTVVEYSKPAAPQTVSSPMGTPQSVTSPQILKPDTIVVGPASPSQYTPMATTAINRDLNLKDLGVPNEDVHDVTTIQNKER